MTHNGDEKKRLYYAIEIHHLISEISVLDAKAMATVLEQFCLVNDKETLQKFFDNMAKAGAAFVPRLSLLIRKMVEVSCCPVHSVIALVSAPLADKIQKESEQPTLH